MRIASNSASIFQMRQLNKSGLAVGTSLQRLSSGLRINAAKDDAAGMQISNKLTTQIKGMTVAMRNASDGISMNQVAEGALQEVNNNLLRMKGLALQAANGTYSKEDRKSIDAEYQHLKSEINRINETTTFGDKRLFTDGNRSIIYVVERDIVKGVQRTWMRESEGIISNVLGIEGKGNLKLDLDMLMGN